MGIIVAIILSLKLRTKFKRGERGTLKLHFGCEKGCKSRNRLIHTLYCGETLNPKDREISQLTPYLKKPKTVSYIQRDVENRKLSIIIGFTNDMIENLLTKKEAIQCSGKIYSEKHRRKFDIKNDIFKVEKHPMDSGKLILTINRIPMGEWFKEQFDKLRQSLRRPTEEPRKSRGFKL